MKFATVLSVAVVCSSLSANAQLSKEYPALIDKAEAAYEAKNYKESAEQYSKAFASAGDKGTPSDRYNAACSWSMAGNADSAFKNLLRLANISHYSDLMHLVADPDLEPVHKDPRWDEVVAAVKKNKEKEEENLNKDAVAMLDSVMYYDQKDRMQIEGVEKKFGRESKEMKELWSSIRYYDSVNTLKVTAVLDKYGWLGPDEAGRDGSNALFFVIQHADLKVQQKYLPMMREAVKNKKASPSMFALLEDRVALRTGHKQIYGSQITRNTDGKYMVDALEDPENVDRRRAEVGLGPLAEYVRRWDIKWDVAEYKKQLPELEKNLSERDR